MSSLQKWIEAALVVANAEGMADEEVIPTWPVFCVERYPEQYPELTVGALREWEFQAARAQGGQGAEPVAWLHQSRPHSDVITDAVKRCWGHIPPKHMQYSIPLYPQPQSAVPEWAQEIGANLKAQNNRITADPLFVVFQKRDIVVAEDYNYDRIVWVGDEGQEPDAETAETLDNLRDDVDSDWWTQDEITLTDDEGEMEWRRLALKTVDEFVTACFTEAGAQDYLSANGHNLRFPFIYVTSLFRNEEMKRLRDWLLSTEPQPQQEGE